MITDGVVELTQESIFFPHLLTKSIIVLSAFSEPWNTLVNVLCSSLFKLSKSTISDSSKDLLFLLFLIIIGHSQIIIMINTRVVSQFRHVILSLS